MSLWKLIVLINEVDKDAEVPCPTCCSLKNGWRAWHSGVRYSGFLMNEYFVELNKAKFKFLNQFFELNNPGKKVIE